MEFGGKFYMDTPHAGDWIELLDMPEDPDPIPVGTLGQVTEVQKFNHFAAGHNPWDPPRQDTILTVRWEIARSLNVVLPKDTVRVIPEEEIPF